MTDTHPLVGSIAALCLAVINTARAQDFTWTSPVTGSWSASANWLGGVGPTAGGSPTLNIKFAPRGATGDFTSTNNLGGNFLLNVLEFDIPISSRLTLTSSPGDRFIFSGTNSRITQNGAGAVIFNSTFEAADGITTVDGTGSGDITINSLNGISAGDILRIAVGPDSPNGQLVSTAVTATGGTVQLDSGNLSLKLGATSGNTNFRINGGSVRVEPGTFTTISGAIELGGSLIMHSTGSATITSAITSVTPTAGLQLRGIGATSLLTLTGASTYTGPTVVDVGVTSATYGGDAGTLRINGNGSILNSSEIDVRATGTLAIETSPTGVTNRIGDTTPVILRGGQLLVEAPTASAGVQSEQIGPVSVSGFSTITVGPASRSVDLIAASLARLQRGTVLFRSPTLTTAGATPARILFTTAPALAGGGGSGPEVSIIPSAIGDNMAVSNGTGLVTYDPATGVRLLNNSTEYASTLATATPTSNLRLTGFAGLAADTTVNSLFFALGSSGISGLSTLTVSSGAILSALNSTSATVTIGPAINFGTSEGQIYAVNDTIFQRSISGSGGLTKSGRGMLTLQANSTFTGPLTINNGKISFSGMLQLGGDLSAIVMSSNSGLRYTGSGLLNLIRPIELLSGYASLENTSSFAVFNASLPISGPGGLRIGTQGATGAVRLGGVNTYEGNTIASFGTLEFASDSALGTGELWIDSAVRLLGDWTTSRAVRILGGTINTGNFNATLNGEFIGSDALTKSGTGALTLTKSSTYSGQIVISAGKLELSNQVTLKSPTISLSAGTSLVLDETGARGDRLSPNSIVTLSDASLSMIGDVSTPSSEKIGNLTLAANTSNTIQFIRPGSASLAFTATDFTPNFSELIVKAENLGGSAGSPNTRLIFENPPPTSDGILFRIYSTPNSGSGQENLTKYDPGSDSAGRIGAKPFAAADYTTGPILQHTDGTANYLVQPGTTVGGTNNFIRTLTLDSGGTLTQSSGQSLVIDDQMLVRSGAPSSVTGGTLKFTYGSATIMAFGDITIDAALVNSSVEKIGPGTLILGAQPLSATTSITIGNGPWRPLSPLVLEQKTIGMDSKAAVLKLAGANASVGALPGTGTVDLGGGTLTVGGSGTDFTLNGTFPTPGQFVIVDGGNPNALRTINLTSSAGGGTVALASGTLRYNDSNTSNPSSLTLAGGVLDVTFIPIFRAPLNLTGNAVVKTESNVTFAPTSIFSGPGSITFTGLLEATIQSATTHTGETIISGADRDLHLQGTNGALLGTSAIRLNQANLDVQYGNSNSERIGNNTEIHIDGGIAYFRGPINNTVVENTGVIFAYPGARLDLGPDSLGTTSVLDLRPAAINRVDGGVLSIEAGTLAAVALPEHVELHPQVAPATVGGGAASGPDTSIIPWIVGIGKFLVTSDPTLGLRILNPDTDFAQGVASVTAPTNNLRIITSQSVTSSMTVNSLYLTETPEPTGANLSGSGTLTITSGLILTDAFGFTRISAPINFGSAEGIFYNEIGATLTVSGPISGTGGVTFAGEDRVILEGTNTFTGPIRLAKSGVYFSKSEALGPDTSPIRIDGGYMYYTGATDGTLIRPIEISDAGASLGNNSNTSVVTFAGDISGPGRVEISGYNVLLTGNNSFTGGLRVNASGTVRFSSDAALGTGDITFGAGRLEPTFNWITNRTIYPYFNATLSSGVYDVQLNGPVLGNGGLRKYGSGSMTLRDADQYVGDLIAEEGTLAIDGFLPAGEPAVGGDRIIGVTGTMLVGNGIWNRRASVGGTLSPGPGIATLTVSEATFSQNSTLQIQIASASSFDQLIVGGMLTLAPTVNLALSLSYDPVDHVDSFTIAMPLSVPGTSQRFTYQGNELFEGESFFVDSQQFQISYMVGDGNNIAIYAVPEPGSALLIMTGLASVLGLGQRRSRRYSARSSRGAGVSSRISL